MAFTRDWDNDAPIDHTLISQGPTKMRNIRDDVSDRLATIVSGFTSGETVLGILNLPFIAVSAPSTVTDQVQLYGKVVSTKTLLHMKDEDGTETVIQGMRSGDFLFSSNTTTPPSFTDVSSTYADKMLRISTTALNTGGSDTHTHEAGSYAGPSHTHSGTTDANNGTSRAAGDTPGNASGEPHTHTFTTGSGGTGPVTGTSASGSTVPAYFTLKAYKKD